MNDILMSGVLILKACCLCLNFLPKISYEQILGLLVLFLHKSYMS